ncbi:VOC family protein [Pseudonocardia sp. TRM90224]|uniref:VOC family protein n=1 Tax=Pseudonocardia sp. TRM90224 TaxID=2812678 RepID=UPI001E4B138A|nr:VOC family protein [Pseudonocardia sp. TRM90224]
MTDAQRPASLHVYIGYRDAPAALGWLERAFGFETTMRWPDENGGILHAEMRRGDAAFSLFSGDYERLARHGETVGHGFWIALPDKADIDAVFASAREEGATVILEPHDTEWGNYRCRVLDLEGYEWAFGTHRPGEPQDWG